MIVRGDCSPLVGIIIVARCSKTHIGTVVAIVKLTLLTRVFCAESERSRFVTSPICSSTKVVGSDSPKE